MVDLSTISEGQWIEAQCCAEVVRPLAERSRCPRRLARVAAQELGISERQVYELVRCTREAGGTLSALLPKEGRGGRGWGRLARPAEELTAQIIEDVYRMLSRPSITLWERDLIRERTRAGLRAAEERGHRGGSLASRVRLECQGSGRPRKGWQNRPLRRAQAGKIHYNLIFGGRWSVVRDSLQFT